MVTETEAQCPDLQKQQEDREALNNPRPITTSAQGLLAHLTDEETEAQGPIARS